MKYRIIGNASPTSQTDIIHFYKIGDVVIIELETPTFSDCKRIGDSQRQSVSNIHLQKLCNDVNKNIKIL